MYPRHYRLQPSPFHVGVGVAALVFALLLGVGLGWRGSPVLGGAHKAGPSASPPPVEPRELRPSRGSDPSTGPAVREVSNAARPSAADHHARVFDGVVVTCSGLPRGPESPVYLAACDPSDPLCHQRAEARGGTVDLALDPTGSRQVWLVVNDSEVLAADVNFEERSCTLRSTRGRTYWIHGYLPESADGGRLDALALDTPFRAAGCGGGPVVLDSSGRFTFLAAAPAPCTIAVASMDGMVVARVDLVEVPEHGDATVEMSDGILDVPRAVSSEAPLAEARLDCQSRVAFAAYTAQDVSFSIGRGRADVQELFDVVEDMRDRCR